MSQAVPAATFLTYDKVYIYKAFAFFFRQKSGKFQQRKAKGRCPCCFQRGRILWFSLWVFQNLCRDHTNFVRVFSGGRSSPRFGKPDARSTTRADSMVFLVGFSGPQLGSYELRPRLSFYAGPSDRALGTLQAISAH